MLKEKKYAWVEENKEFFSNANFAYIIRYKGLPSSELSALRKSVKAQGRFSFVKNSLAKIAVKDTPCELLTDHFKEVSILVAGKDPIETVKASMDFIKKHKSKLSVVGGIMDGKALTSETVVSFGKIPGLQELRAQIAFMLQYPLMNIVDTISRSAETK